MTELTKDNFSQSLLGHCGFAFEQLLPVIGSTQARFVNRPGGATAGLTYKTAMEKHKVWETVPMTVLTNDERQNLCRHTSCVIQKNQKR